jgi:hypothetical protein
MFHRQTARLLAGVACALGLGVQLIAQSASIVLRSGERRPAQNIGFFDGNQLIVRTSFEEEPRFPIDQVAYIDFGGASDTAIRLNGSPAGVVLRNGQVLRGQVIRIGHANDDQQAPYLISFRTSGGDDRQLSGNDVARVYFGEPTATASSGQSGRFRRRDRGIATSGASDLRVVTVSARQRWTSTGIVVNRGERWSLQTSGQIRLNRGGVTASPDGGNGNDPGSPLPNTLVGALIGRIGNGQPFAIGSQTSIGMPDSGELFFGVNDSQLNDNDGAFRVELRRTIQ